MNIDLDRVDIRIDVDEDEVLDQIGGSAIFEWIYQNYDADNALAELAGRYSDVEIKSWAEQYVEDEE